MSFFVSSYPPRISFLVRYSWYLTASDQMHPECSQIETAYLQAHSLLLRPLLLRRSLLQRGICRLPPSDGILRRCLRYRQLALSCGGAIPLCGELLHRLSRSRGRSSVRLCQLGLHVLNVS